MLSDDAIGIVTIKNNEYFAFRKSGKNSVSNINHNSIIHFDKACLNELNCERIVFDRNMLILNEATICDNKTFKLCSGSITLAMPNRDEIEGQYEMVKEGKGYKLYKI